MSARLDKYVPILILFTLTAIYLPLCLKIKLTAGDFVTMGGGCRYVSDIFTSLVNELSGGRIEGLRILVVTLHVVTATLLFLVVKRATQNILLGVASSILFGVLYMNSGVVFSTCKIYNPVFSCFAVLTMALFLHFLDTQKPRHYCYAMLTLVVAFFSKETALFLPLFLTVFYLGHLLQSNERPPHLVEKVRSVLTRHTAKILFPPFIIIAFLFTIAHPIHSHYSSILDVPAKGTLILSLLALVFCPFPPASTAPAHLTAIDYQIAFLFVLSLLLSMNRIYILTWGLLSVLAIAPVMMLGVLLPDYIYFVTIFTMPFMVLLFHGAITGLIYRVMPNYASSEFINLILLIIMSLVALEVLFPDYIYFVAILIMPFMVLLFHGAITGRIYRVMPNYASSEFINPILLIIMSLVVASNCDHIKKETRHQVVASKVFRSNLEDAHSILSRHPESRNIYVLNFMSALHGTIGGMNFIGVWSNSSGFIGDIIYPFPFPMYQGRYAALCFKHNQRPHIRAITIESLLPVKEFNGLEFWTCEDEEYRGLKDEEKMRILGEVLKSRENVVLLWNVLTRHIEDVSGYKIEEIKANLNKERPLKKSP